MSEAALGTQDSACVSGGAACSRAEKPTLSYGKPNEDNRRLNRRSVKSCDRLNDENSPVVAKRLSKPRSNRSTDARSGEENAINGWALELVGMAATASTQSERDGPIHKCYRLMIARVSPRRRLSLVEPCKNYLAPT